MPDPDSQTIQRTLTVDFLTRKRLNVPAIWLRPESLVSASDDATRAPDHLNTDLGDWRDNRNLGVRLVDGFIELKIKTPDDMWTKQLFRACAYLHIDTRAASAPRSAPVNSILFHIDDPASIDDWRSRWPRGGRDKAGNWIETRFTASELPTPRSKPLWRDSSPLPGSHFKGRLIVWRPKGKPEAETLEQGFEDLEPRPIAPTTMEAIVRAIAYATLAYWLDVYLDGLRDWDASLTRTIGAWLARVVREGKDINAQGKSLEGVCWAPVDTEETATDLLNFLEASSDLRSTFVHALAELERNPVAPVAGWGSIETLFGVAAKQALRRVLRAGLDIDAIERMAERYIFNTSAHIYLDRDDLLKALPYEHKQDQLIERHDNEPVFVGGKPRNPFRLYSTSSLRTDVQGTEFFPGQDPGAILKFSRVHGLLGKEQRTPDDYSVLNAFPGFAIRPIATPDPNIMSTAVSMLDRVLGLLTQDNDAQILWLKKFLAHIAQSPQEKPQVCPIIVGGQGIGKSVFGGDFMSALFGSMAGSAAAADLNDNRFLITPFIGKLITFVDEVRLENVGSINTIKKLVRSEYVSGQVKFGHQRDYYIPSRLLIASNSANIGLSSADAADRAFFFIMAWNDENKGMTDREFQGWALGLKGFYADFTTALKSVNFRQHLMRYFVDLPVTREELENLEHSSRNDAIVVRSIMSKARDIARQIAAEAHVDYRLDITAWFNSTTLHQAIERVDGKRSSVTSSQVMMEYQRANVIERMQGDSWRFRWGYGKLLQKLGDVHNLPLHALWPTGPGDYEDNDVKSWVGAPAWRGLKHGQKKEEPPPRDPDYMDNF